MVESMDFMVKGSYIKQQPYRSCGFGFKWKEQGLCLNLLKTDCGFENGDVAAIDCFLTRSNLSQRYGASHANQRIENWWSHFKWSFSAWVIDYFKQLVQDDIFVAGNVVHIEYTWYVYAVFLQHKLDEVKNE